MPRPRNPFLNRVCEDTAYCLTQRGNPCGIPSSERAGMRDWYIRNCGGTPELVAKTRGPRVFPVGGETRKLAAAARRSKLSKTAERALNRSLGRTLKRHLGIPGKTTVQVRALFDRPARTGPGRTMARKRLIVLRDGCTEYYGYYDDESQECVYIGAGYVEGCDAD